MSDEEVVELLGKFLLTNNEIDAFKRAADLRAYLRAEGCEVVRWRTDMDTPKPAALSDATQQALSADKLRTYAELCSRRT